MSGLDGLSSRFGGLQLFQLSLRAHDRSMLTFCLRWINLRELDVKAMTSQTSWDPTYKPCRANVQREWNFAVQIWLSRHVGLGATAASH